MTETALFSETLKERTWSAHGDSEHSGFMEDLMRGNGTREDYIELVAQHYFIYEAIEERMDELKDNPEIAKFNFPELIRIPSLVADLEHLLGEDWRNLITPLPATVRYVERIKSLDDWAGGLIAHQYCRYLGDLSGGQIIKVRMQRFFGFEKAGVEFYMFEGIENPREFKVTYRDNLDNIGWDLEEQNRVVDEVLVAYQLNTDLFQEMSAAKLAALS